MATLALASVATALPAQGCVIRRSIDLEDVRFADTVIVGRIVNYRIIQDEGFRWRREQLARRDLPPDLRRRFERQTSFLSDYALFDILVDEVLVGRPPLRLTVTWDNSTFDEPASMPRSPFLIALRNGSSPRPPMRAPSATILPTPPGGPTLLQAACAGAFIFEAGSEQAREIRDILSRPAAR